MVGDRRCVRALGLILILAGGCAVAPKSKLDDCHRQSQALQAENAQWKDAAARLRDQNRDYAQRAVEDARRLHALEQANDQLERAVVAYQDDVRRLESAVDRIVRQVQADPPASARRTPP